MRAEQKECSGKQKHIGARNRFRLTVDLCILVVATNVVGNYALARGLRHISLVADWQPVASIGVISHFWVGAGVVLMGAWLIARLALLSWADLSYVLLVTSFTYVLSALAGVVGLGEDVSWYHWLGICIITGGVLMAGRTDPRTTDHHSEIEE